MIILPNMKSIIGKKINTIAQKIVVGGDFIQYNYGPQQNYIIRLNSNGIPDTAFDIGTGFDAGVSAIAVQSDKKIIVGGDFITYNYETMQHIIRLNSNGTRDTAFNIGTGFDTYAGLGSVYAIAIQSDGKIVVGGYFFSYNGTDQSFITRLNPDGTRDITFNIGTGFNGEIRAIAIQPDGKIVVGGYFSFYNETEQLFITRLNSDGTLDTGFNIGTGLDGHVAAIAIQSDGKIVIGGGFLVYNGTEQFGITRLNPNGTRDTTFDIGTGFDNFVCAIAIQPDNKIVVGGNFATYNGTLQFYVTRLNSNGNRDTGFAGLELGMPPVKSLAIQSDGKIVAGAAASVFRLNSDGTLDTGFTGINFDNQVNSIILI